MRQPYTKLIVILLSVAVLMTFISVPASGEQVKCEYCTEEYPCVTVFEFRNVKFVHNVFCKVDNEGREIWNSKDETKFDMFYFESPNDFDKKNKLDL